MLTGICTLFAACSEQEENESLINTAIEGEETVDVSLSLSLSPEVYLNGNTDYQPMATRAGETDPDKVLSLIHNTYRCLVLKEINSQWYVERLADMKLTNGGFGSVKVTATTKFNDLQLTLQPGHYKILAVLNPYYGLWNPGLVPGAIVKNETDTITHAYTYLFQPSYSYGNHGKREVGAEIFAGTAEFEVVKTSDLHTDPINGNTTISFTRKVTNMRFLLKDNGDKTDNSTNFILTSYLMLATLKATQPGAVFCDGLDCWGKAYYNRQKSTTELEICLWAEPNWKTAFNGSQYHMTGHDATVYSPYVYTDNEQSIPYQIKEFQIYGQSGEFTYIYRQPIENLTLVNNTIQQLVFQATDEVAPKPSSKGEVTLQHLENEDSMDLFDDYYEHNIK